MKLFQQLLVAPAALGLIAPVAATAAELNINGVSGYSDTLEEVQGINDFSDVYPTDWAYQALTNLADRHGCVAATPNGSMTRYEAAALLDQCLGNVSQVNEEERRLLTEFGPELAVIKGRIDGLEARVGEFEAGQFSTTTKLTGTVNFVVGGVDRDTSTTEATTFTYSQQLNLNTSFTGSDLLYTRIKTGNFGSDALSSKDYGTYMSATNSNGNVLQVDKLWYQFPVGDDFQVWVGPRIENYYMLASSPSIYKPVLKQFALGGNGGAYGASTDGGFGVAWTQQVEDRSAGRWAISTNYVSKGASDASDDGGGLLSDVDAAWLTKVEYGAPRWQLSAAVNHKSCYSAYTGSTTCFDGGSYYSTDKGDQRTGDSLNFGLRGYWKPLETGFVPAIQVGYDISSIDDDNAAGSVENSQAWMLGFMWNDLFVDGNRGGIAIGARQHATEIDGETSANDDDADDNFVWEAYYDFKVSDNITITPAIFGGEDTKDGADNGSDDIFGALVKTTFKF